MKVHQALAATLDDAGVDLVFGLIGDANLFLVDAFVNQHDGRYVAAVHEAGAVMMAHGYACRTGRVGVATVTQGPGLTNAVTALVECVRNNTPVVVITGDTAPSNRLNAQTIAQEPVVASTGAAFVQVSEPGEAAPALANAMATAAREQTPVVVNVPTEFQWSDVDYERVALPSTRTPGVPATDDLDRAVGVIASAARPLVLVGYGALEEPHRAASLKFAERIGAPVATTLRAKGLFSSGEGSIGVFGTLSTPTASEIIGEADCIVALGASLNTWTTVRGDLLRGKALVHADVKASAVGRHAAVTAGIVGDADIVASTIVEWLDEAEIRPSGFRTSAMQRMLDDPGHRPSLGRHRLNFSVALSALNAHLSGPRTIVFDGGRFMGEAFKYIDAPEPRRQVLSSAFGAVGLGMGAAIGAANAAPDELTVLVTGDGGFMMSGMNELHSMMRSSGRLVVIVCNDGSYGAEYDQFKNANIDPALSLFEWPSFAAVAEALGARSVVVETPADLDIAAAALASTDTPLLIDVQTDADAVPEVPH